LWRSIALVLFYTRINFPFVYLWCPVVIALIHIWLNFRCVFFSWCFCVPFPHNIFHPTTYHILWPGSAVGIATRYGLEGPVVESRWGRDFPHPGAHPASCTIGIGFFLRVKSGWNVTLTPHPILVPWSRKSRAIPLLPLWAVRPVQSLSACTRVYFNFTYHIHAFTARMYVLRTLHRQCCAGIIVNADKLSNTRITKFQYISVANFERASFYGTYLCFVFRLIYARWEN
jgi:hypothetical protein